MTSRESVQEERIEMPLMNSPQHGLSEAGVEVLYEAGIVVQQLGILRTSPRSPTTLTLTLALEAERSSEFSICPLLFVAGEKNLQQSVLLQEVFLLRSSVQMAQSLKLHSCQMLTPANQKVKERSCRDKIERWR